jgi:DNA-binding Lrp family transcriptional regulator
MTTTTVQLAAHAIDPAELDEIRRTGRDTAGNAPVLWPDPAGVPLRCCLRRAHPDDEVVLVSYAPQRRRSPWREVGPVFVHARPCAGWTEEVGLPAELRVGPRVLRGYRADGSLDYDAIRVVPDGEDVERPLQELLEDPAVDEVHVRALAEQCFTYRVRAAGR